MGPPRASLVASPPAERARQPAGTPSFVFFELAAEIERLADDESVRAVVFRSANPEWFLAHFDVEAIQQFPREQPEPTAIGPRLRRRRRRDPRAVGLGESSAGGLRDRRVRSGRIASFPAHAVAAVKASVVRSEVGVEADLLAESIAFNATLASDETHDRMQRFHDAGGQTPDGERRLAELAGEL